VERIVILGSGGAGKSRFARCLGVLLSIEVTHLDVLYWHPGWQPSKGIHRQGVDPRLDHAA